MKLLSIDPGKNTGWAIWYYGERNPTLQQMGVTKSVDQFYDFLINLGYTSFDTVVYEDYLIRPASMNHRWGHEWSGAPALHVIGAIEFYAKKCKATLVKQQPSILPVGCGYIGHPYRKGIHVPNNVSAIAHGAYWLVKNKHADSRGFKIVTS